MPSARGEICKKEEGRNGGRVPLRRQSYQLKNKKGAGMCVNPMGQGGKRRVKGKVENRTRFEFQKEPRESRRGEGGRY